MPSADQHRHKAERNREFLDTISREEFPDWVVVAAFYTVVHIVERLRAAAHEGHSENHGDRQRYVEERHRTIYPAYKILQNASMLARYQSMGDFYRQLDAETVERLILTRLDEIERYAGM
jgi:hypothetical protein